MASNNCLDTIGSGLPDLGLAADSPIFTAIANAVDAVAEVQQHELNLPDLTRLELVNDIAGLDSELEDVGPHDSGNPPTADLDKPSLEASAYKATRSVIDFIHNSPLIPNIQYQDGTEPYTLPSADILPPPLAYPEEGKLAIPAQPSIEREPKPELTIGARADLAPIDWREYDPELLEPLELPAFELTDFELPDVRELDWSEPIHYDDDLALREKLKQLMAGNDELTRWVSGLVQDVLHKADTRGLSRQAHKEVERVMADAAARGFSLPTGAAESAAADIFDGEADKGFTAAQTIRDEVYEAGLAVVLQAISQSINVERYHFSLHVRYVQQNLQVYRLNLQLGLQAAQAVLELYNRVVEAVGAQVDAYNQFVSGIVAQNQAYAEQANLASAKVDTQQSKVAMFEADVAVLRAIAEAEGLDVRQDAVPIELYSAYLRGAVANVGILKQNVASFSRAVGAYSEATNWVQDLLQAYEASIDASSSQSSVNEANLGAYQTLWRSEEERIRAYEDYVRSSTGLMDAELGYYREATQSSLRYLSAINDCLSSSVQAISAYDQAARASVGYTDDYNRAKTSYSSASDRLSISQGIVAMTEESLEAEAVAYYASIDAAKLSSDLNAASALSQAASSILNVNVSASGDVREAVSGDDAGSRDFSTSVRKTWSNRCIERVRPATG